MYFSSASTYLILSLGIARLCSGAPWQPGVEDDATELAIDEVTLEERDFYASEAGPYQPEQNESLTGDTSSASDRFIVVKDEADDDGNDLRRRQSTSSTESPSSAGGLNTGPTQNINATSQVNTSDGTQTTTGSLPGLIPPPDNPNADKVNCSDLLTGRSNTCWAQLDLTNYVLEWNRTHQCYPNEGFASCYLRLNGLFSLDCAYITVNSCPPPQDDSLQLDPQKFYVAYNIHAINSFFYSWWVAVGNSGGIAVDNLGKIIQIVDPPSQLSLTVQKVLIAFQSVFALAPGIAGVWAAKTEKSYSYQIGAQSISNALTTVPNIGRFFFPTDTADSQVVQLADLSSNFAGILTQVQNNLNKTLTSVMANVTEFLAFAEQGNFTSAPEPLSDQANYLYYAFNTYLISQALNGNNIYAVIGKGTNVHDLATNGTQTAYPIDCTDGYNEEGICDAWWWSGNYNSSFTLDNFSHMDRNYGTELTTLFSNLTSGELLFEGAYACNSQGNFGGPVNITITTQGVNTACISQLKTLTWDMTCHAHDEQGEGPAPDCEFLEIPRQQTFWYNNMRLLISSPQRSVPAGYLGPAIAYKPKVPLKRD